jgi:hypothetical protein
VLVPSQQGSDQRATEWYLLCKRVNGYLSLHVVLYCGGSGRGLAPTPIIYVVVRVVKTLTSSYMCAVMFTVGGLNKRLNNCQAQARGPMGVAIRPVLKCASACGVARAIARGHMNHHVT